MYTIGQVAKFLGVSRDTLKFYEEKELVKPKQDMENGYRKYDHFDIYDITTVNFYREVDIEIKKIQELRKSKSIEGIKSLLEEKEQEALEEIEYKKLLLKKLQTVKEDCEKVKQFLGEYIVKEMKPLEIKGEIEHFTAFDEYETVKKNAENLKKAVTLTSLRRVINFNEEGIIDDKLTNITYSRKVIGLVNRKWLEENIESYIEQIPISEPDDEEWKYRRVAELYVQLGFEKLLNSHLSFCSNHHSLEIKEIAEDYGFSI